MRRNPEASPIYPQVPEIIRPPEFPPSLLDIAIDLQPLSQLLTVMKKNRDSNLRRIIISGGVIIETLGSNPNIFKVNPQDLESLAVLTNYCIENPTHFLRRGVYYPTKHTVTLYPDSIIFSQIIKHLESEENPEIIIRKTNADMNWLPAQIAIHEIEHSNTVPLLIYIIKDGVRLNNLLALGFSTEYTVLWLLELFRESSTPLLTGSKFISLAGTIVSSLNLLLKQAQHKRRTAYENYQRRPDEEFARKAVNHPQLQKLASQAFRPKLLVDDQTLTRLSSVIKKEFRRHNLGL